MGLLKFLSLFFLLSQVYSADLNDVQKAFIQHDVVPTVLDSPPEKLLKVKYSDSAVAQLGNELPFLSVLHQPTFDWDADPNTYYTLAMIGYPVEPEINLKLTYDVRHMLLSNIKGKDVNTAEVLVTYLPPIPPPGFGSQRYTFLEYRQPGPLDLTTDLISKYIDRLHFNVTEFANEFNLDLESGNFALVKIL